MDGYQIDVENNNNASSTKSRACPGKGPFRTAWFNFHGGAAVVTRRLSMWTIILCRIGMDIWRIVSVAFGWYGSTPLDLAVAVVDLLITFFLM